MRIKKIWPSQYVFLLTHSDSLIPAFAALLHEQLGIVGVPGSGLAYQRCFDWLRLRWQVGLTHRAWPLGRFIFDAITENQEQHSLMQTASSSPQALVCIRRPADALLEILATPPTSSLSQAADTYCDRLECLAAASGVLGDRALVFRTETIVEDTNVLLAAIAAHLGVEGDFRVHLPSIPKADERWENRSPRTAPSSNAPLDPVLMSRCQEAYHYALIELGQRCRSIGLPSYAGDRGSTWLEQSPATQAAQQQDHAWAMVTKQPLWEHSLELAAQTSQPGVLTGFMDELTVELQS